LFRSSLQGLFTDYTATFEHLDGLGDKRFSLIDRVEIHEMNHLVQADRTFADGRPDFLVNDVPDFDDLPDHRRSHPVPRVRTKCGRCMRWLKNRHHARRPHPRNRG
jgi:hypothetical protein